LLCWNVYYGDFNAREIKVYNIFNHWGFYDACVKVKKKYGNDREEFDREIRGWLMYYFWSKCEWETVITHWPDGELYELRKDMTLGETCDAFRNAGVDLSESDTFRMKNDRPVTVRVYLRDYVKEDLKIDVYDQVVNNWDIFINWLWDHRSELKARK